MHKKIKQMHSKLPYILYGVLCIFVLLKGVVVWPDTSGFLAMDFHRSIGYNLFLNCFFTVFGEHYGYSVIIVQLLALMFASYFLLKTIQRIFNLHIIGVLISQLIILAPAFYLHFVVNSILSEGLAYPLFLCFTAFILDAFFLDNDRSFFKGTAVLLILMLTRGQFIAMIPALCIFLLVDGVLNKFDKKRVLKFLTLISIPLISSVISKSYNLWVYGHFAGTPFNNVSLITAPFYVSDASDYKLFSNLEQQQYFKDVYSRLEDYGVTKSQVRASQSEPYIIYHENYSKICNWSIHEIAKQHFKAKGLDRNEQLLAADNLARDMLIPLLKDNLGDWFKLYINNLKNAFGAAKYLILYVLIAFIASVCMFKRKDNLSKFIFIISLLLFANTTIIPLAVHSIKRYLFYTDWVIFVIIVLMFNEIYFSNQYQKAQLNDRS